MENLTKENFWNKVNEAFPSEMEAFCKWIDEYKEKVEWKKLFNYGFPNHSRMGWHNPKFHDLPIAMQIGIFFQFAHEHGGGDNNDSVFAQYGNNTIFIDFWRHEISYWFTEVKSFHQRETVAGENFSE